MTETIKIKKEIKNKNKIIDDNNFRSEIINKTNCEIFESLICKTDKLKLLYRMSRDGNNKESIQNKIENHSNLIDFLNILMI